MNLIRNVTLAGLGLVLAVWLATDVQAVLAAGPAGQWFSMMGGSVTPLDMASHLTAGQHNMAYWPTNMGGMGGHMGGTGGHMGGGGTRPAECQEQMSDPEMMQHMMAMMHGDEPFDLAQCEDWMTEHGMSDETQTQCLAHMAELAGETPIP